MRRVALWTSRFLILIFIAWLAAEGLQWMFRRRAQRLLADIKGLELNRSNWSDAQRLMRRWGGWGKWYGDCNAQDCQYSINLNETLPDSPQFVYEGGPHIGGRILGHVGLRSTRVSAGFHVAKGVVTNKSFGMEVALPIRDWMTSDGVYWPSLDVGSSESATLRDDNPHFHASRPNRSFVQRRITLEANFTPEESPEERAALMDFRFDCITRWSPCLSRAEILPRADEEFEDDMSDWRQLEIRGNETDANNYFTPTCFPTLEIRAREAPDVLVGDIVRSRIVQEPGEDDPRYTVWMADVRLVQVLKGKAPRPVGSTISVYLPPKTAPSNERGAFHQVVLTGYTDEGWGTHDLVFNVGDCGIAEASQENLEAARKGIEEDFGPRY
jgi:hypothetical protein